MIELHNSTPPIGECVLAKLNEELNEECGPRYYVFNVIKVNEEICLEEAGGEQYMRASLQDVEGWITLDELDKNISVFAKEDCIYTIPTATKPLRVVLPYIEPRETKEVPVFINGQIEKREAQVITVHAENIPMGDWDETFTFTFGENDYENNDLTTFFQ